MSTVSQSSILEDSTKPWSGIQRQSHHPSHRVHVFCEPVKETEFFCTIYKEKSLDAGLKYAYYNDTYDYKLFS